MISPADRKEMVLMIESVLEKALAARAIDLCGCNHCVAWRGKQADLAVARAARGRYDAFVSAASESSGQVSRLITDWPIDHTVEVIDALTVDELVPIVRDAKAGLRALILDNLEPLRRAAVVFALCEPAKRVRVRDHVGSTAVYTSSEWDRQVAADSALAWHVSEGRTVATQLADDESRAAEFEAWKRVPLNDRAPLPALPETR